MELQYINLFSPFYLMVLLCLHPDKKRLKCFLLCGGERRRFNQYMEMSHVFYVRTAAELVSCPHRAPTPPCKP